MSDPVDLANLRDMTGGDKDIERELFEVFITSSEECLAGLKASLFSKDDETWRGRAHAWKGISYSLGAEKLGALCKEAQEGYSVSYMEKQRMLEEMENEYQEVKHYLNFST
jgi:histidine phosphotransfer protein HptB